MARRGWAAGCEADECRKWVLTAGVAIQGLSADAVIIVGVVAL